MQSYSHPVGQLASQFKIHSPVQIGADEIWRLWHNHTKAGVVVELLAKGQHSLPIRQQALEQLVELSVAEVGFL